MASYKAASTCRGAKSAAEDAWLLQGNTGPLVDSVLWKRMYKGIQVYKGTKLADKVAISPLQVRKKIEHMMVRGRVSVMVKLAEPGSANSTVDPLIKTDSFIREVYR